MKRNRFDCMSCGTSIAVDEDGCCASCGRQAARVGVDDVPDYRGILAGMDVEEGEVNRLRTALAVARAEALEEAARLCDAAAATMDMENPSEALCRCAYEYAASRIRALASREEKGGGRG